MSRDFSSLTSSTSLSPNHSGTRTHTIDRITPHCIVGQCSEERCKTLFSSSSREASSNYCISYDGKVVGVVSEKNRSWCSSSNANDQRAITIECASDSTAPYAFTDACYNKLVDLCVDICKAYNKTKLIWIEDKTTALAYSPASNEMLLTVHRWFANKSCPGDWMYSRMGKLASTVTERLGTTTATTNTTTTTYPTVPFKVKVIISDLNYRSEPSMSGTVKGQTGKGTFTIVQVSDDWGKLKSGAGWIYLGNSSYTTIGKTVASSTATATKSVDEIAKEVIAGKWGNGADRKAKLTAAGYDYSAVQKRVNQLLA